MILDIPGATSFTFVSYFNAQEFASVDNVAIKTFNKHQKGNFKHNTSDSILITQFKVSYRSQ